MEELINQYRYLISGYYGVSLMDEYPVKEFILEEIDEYINDIITSNPIDNYNYEEERVRVKDTFTKKRKLQDALIVLKLINGPMDLVFMVKKELKKYR